MELVSPARRMPIPEDVRDLLRDLLDRPAAVTRRRVEAFDTERRIYVTGRYISDRDQLIGACVLELRLAAAVGAALSMMSAGVVREAERAERIDGALRENVHEIINIASALLNGALLPHLRLSEVVDGVPADVIELAGRGTGHKHYDVTIEGYDGGSMALIAI